MLTRRIVILTEDEFLERNIAVLLPSPPYQLDFVSRKDVNRALRVKPHLPLALIIDISERSEANLNFIRRLKTDNPHLSILLISKSSSPRLILEAVRTGATDFLIQPSELDRLPEAVSELITSTFMLNYARDSHAEAATMLFGPNQKMLEIKALIIKIADLDVPVLITGEPGSGRKLMARVIHWNSPWKERPFSKMSTSTFPRELLVHEMSINRKTGGLIPSAPEPSNGRNQLGDTILFDEIGDADHWFQANLVTYLKNSELRHAARDKNSLDTRILATTHRDLESEVRKGRFRSDLYCRLSVVTIQLPPLRERKEDISELTEYFLKKYATELRKPPLTLSDACIKRLRTHDWPGNVRELENLIKTMTLQGNERAAGELQQNYAAETAPLKEPSESSPPRVSTP